MRQRLLPIASLTLLAAALPNTQASEVHSDRTLPPITPPGSPANVREVRLFGSDDNGASWMLLQQKFIAATSSAMPTMGGTVPRDGQWMLLTSMKFHPGKGVDQDDPKPGKTSTAIVNVDTTPPRLKPGALTAQRVAGGATLAVSVAWSAEDANFIDLPVRIEISPDGGRSYPITSRGPAVGGLNADVVLSEGSERPLVRFTATDQGGLVSMTSALPITMPPTVDPVAAVRRAVLNLPPPPMLAVETTSAPAATASQTPIASRDPVKAPEPEVATIATTPGQRSPVREPQAVAPAPIEVVGREASQNQRYNEALSGVVRQPATDPTTAAPTTTVTSTRVRGLRPDETTAFLSGDAATQALATAHAAAAAGRDDDALAGYLQLHHSELAEQAIASEFALLRRLGDWTTLAGRTDALPAHLLTSDARADGGYAHLALGQTERAIALTSRVAKNSPRARDAMLTLAKAYQSSGNTAAATRLLSMLADGDDSIAAAAKALLGK